MKMQTLMYQNPNLYYIKIWIVHKVLIIRLRHLIYIISSYINISWLISWKLYYTANIKKNKKVKSIIL